jgi:hypothetical protein
MARVDIFPAEGYGAHIRSVNELSDKIEEVIALLEVGGFTKTYWFYPADSATASAPIVHGAGSTTTYLTNNGLAPRTRGHNPDAKAPLWNTTTNSFDFTSLKIGDIVELRVDLLVDHAAAQELNVVIDLAEGTSSAYTLNVNHAYYKTASTNVPITAMFRMYIGDADTRDSIGRLRIESIAAASIVVEGWLVVITSV